MRGEEGAGGLNSRGDKTIRAFGPVNTMVLSKLRRNGIQVFAEYFRDSRKGGGASVYYRRKLHSEAEAEGEDTPGRDRRRPSPYLPRVITNKQTYRYHSAFFNGAG